MACILVFEDDSETTGEIVAELASPGPDVAHASDGVDGLDRATRQHFDAITLDRMLPGLDGLALIERVRTRWIEVPVLMISAFSEVDR
ncbi:response regulator [Sphingomonas glacialis]|uniref:DNA-binding response regulator n=1 Tax=Sphingomonas glacialis TaxID=658225 RepID=A0A502G4T5_9SPHN|nr:response regulator [Sphingomonas glacialis]TPG56562.1 DNA-binding response regulator [Sphingomonas glacialis]